MRKLWLNSKNNISLSWKRVGVKPGSFFYFLINMKKEIYVFEINDTLYHRLVYQYILVETNPFNNIIVRLSKVLVGNCIGFTNLLTKRLSKRNLSKLDYDYISRLNNGVQLLNIETIIRILYSDYKHDIRCVMTYAVN